MKKEKKISQPINKYISFRDEFSHEIVRVNIRNKIQYAKYVHLVQFRRYVQGRVQRVSHKPTHTF